ncbi:TM2 domain-containing protein [uncultured Neglectibacter sp.]|uniref:TM2 domain-containing protein n=1 Tax=uncultured Neglectibacter sp. TaxID=1924108 RepID=UPI0034E01705
MSDYRNYNNGNNQPPMYNPPQYQPQAGMEPPPGYPQRSRIAAGILAILLGTYGIHSFYLGNTSRGLMQLLISLLTCGVGAIVIAIWGILDGIKLLDGRINVDANGVFLKD